MLAARAAFAKKIFPFLLVFFETATYLSSDMYLPALPDVIRDFSISQQQAQWTLTAWFLGSISVQLILGPLADRFGRKKVLCWGAVVFTLATLACGIAQSYSFLLVARFFQGMGICFMAVPGYAVIHESYEQREAIKLMAVMGSFAILAPALGPLVGSLLLLVGSWRWIFAFLVLWSASSVLLLFWWMPETLPPEKRLPLQGSKALSVYWKILRNGRFMAFLTTNGLVFCGFISWIIAGPFLVMSWFKESPLAFGLYQTLIFACLIFGNYCIKKFVDRTHPRRLIRIGLSLCLVISIFGLIFSMLKPQMLSGIIFAYMVYAYGSAFTFAPLNRLAVESSTESMSARMAIFSLMMSGFATLGSLLSALFYKGPPIDLTTLIFGSIVLAFCLERLIAQK